MPQSSWPRWAINESVKGNDSRGQHSLDTHLQLVISLWSATKRFKICGIKKGDKREKLETCMIFIHCMLVPWTYCEYWSHETCWLVLHPFKHISIRISILSLSGSVGKEKQCPLCWHRLFLSNIWYYLAWTVMFEGTRSNPAFGVP